MRVLCPSCQQLVNVADESAGKPTPCPQCGQSFTPPAMTGYSLDASPPPPPPPPASTVPPPRTPDRLPSPAAPVTRSGAGELCCSCTLRRAAVRWIAPIALIFAFVLSCLTWIASAPNGTPVYTQNAWKASRGAFAVDHAGEQVMGKEQELRAGSGWNGWLVLYLIVLVIVVILSVADLVMSLMQLTVPDVLRSIWPHRSLLIAGLTAILIVGLVAPMFSDIGLEAAAAAAAEKAVPAPQAGPDVAAPTTTQAQLRDIRRDVAVNAFAVHRTCWLWFTLLAIVIALIGALMSLWLERRGDEPEPRIDFYC